MSENFYNGVAVEIPEYWTVPTILVDPTPVVGIDRSIVVCNTICISQNKDGTYISAIWSTKQEQQYLLNELRLIGPEALCTLVALAEDWHGTFRDLIRAAKELS